jgi:hypothetical protein
VLKKIKLPSGRTQVLANFLACPLHLDFDNFFVLTIFPCDINSYASPGQIFRGHLCSTNISCLILRIQFLILRIQFLILRILFLIFKIQFLIFKIQFFIFKIQFIIFKIQFFIFKIQFLIINIQFLIYIIRILNTHNSNS